MNISYNWLKEYINLDLSSEELEQKLTFSGIEVEGTKIIGQELEQILIGKIIDKVQHPDADKLSLCKVDIGDDVLDVVCGAPNCGKEQKIAFAPIGSKIGEMKIKKTKIRGQISYGMICSGKELGISNDHDGILVLPDDAPVGKNFADYLGKKDVVYELEITPNRPDLLGFIGIARDLSSLLNLKLKTPEITLKCVTENIQDNLQLANLNPIKCPRYTARMIKNVTIKESPQWLQDRLLSIGLRPINNIVDVTNFVMMEYGHPLHAFDYDKLDGKKIIVRDAYENEEFPALDEISYKLTKNDLVIADANKPIALAGVMGGENSHITSETKNIVIEAANFLYSSIRKTSGNHKIFTDSSYRFERNISNKTAEDVSQRAIQLILATAGGELLAGVLDSYPGKDTEINVSLRPTRVKKILTIDLTENKIIEYLESLGLKLIDKSADNLNFEIPHYRNDLTREIDLIEEIIRLHGYNNVETFTVISHIMDKTSFYGRRLVQDIMVKYGLFEIVNWSFADPQDLNKLNISDDDLRKNYVSLLNPLGSSFSILRTTLLPGLLKNLKYNLNHGTKDLKLFEMNKVFFASNDKLPTEEYVLSTVFTGNRDDTNWLDKPEQIDFYDIKGIIEDVIFEFDLKNCKFEKTTESFYQSGTGADIFWTGIKIATLGKIDAKILEKFDIKQTVFGLEIYFDKIISKSGLKEIIYQPISKYPAITRDISFLIKDNIEVNKIIHTIKEVNQKIIKKVVLFDEYKGKNIKEGIRSLSFNIILNSPTKTLTDEYANKLLNKIIKKMESEYKIEMR
ncbi:MAG: phenylalanine--tRNA ligase subunit beta [Candidatus Cloacimonetes bacterium]|nr:phenylalanine--tRNA ligase subunit beta [Candidatus Cloacimonadota bacterium]